jgi:hypothetical protein
MALRVTTGKVRLSFPHLFEPRSTNPNDAPKYSTMVLIPKSDKETLAKLRAAEAEAAAEAKAWGNRAPKKWDSVIHDGDEDDLERYPEREGHWHFSTRSSADYKPGVVDKNVEPILDRSEVYSGVYARVSVTAFTFDFQGKKGVSFGLNNVQILGGGENLSGSGAPASADFDAVEDDDLI